MTKFIYLVLLFCMHVGCAEEAITPDQSLPSDLSFEVTVQEDGSGIVDMSATALNVTEYRFYAGEDSQSDPIVNTDGNYSHVYANSGNYQVEVRAYGSSGMFLKKTKSITVLVGDDDGTVDISEGYTTPLSYDGMSLTWQDEFDGTSIDPDKWAYDLGNGCPSLCGWGNNELEFYKRENGIVKDGVFTLEAKKERFQDNDYTSTKVISQDKFAFKYGRVDIRAVLPIGKGMWPALWMLGTNITTVGWPACGELDIMELVGGKAHENKVSGNARWDQDGLKDDSGTHTLTSGTFADKYHVFSIIWDKVQIAWYVDDVLYHTVNIEDPALSEFHEEFYFIMNLAVGGDWPGSPDASTLFPQKMMVDYIRVFQDTE